MIVDGSSYTLLKRPFFMVFEGVNGVGKSTLLNNVAQKLSTFKGENSVVKTREPGGTPLGVQLRKLLQESPDICPSVTSELLMFAADRSEHVEKVIRPALKSGASVLSDRYYYSTVAFQGYGRGVEKSLIESLSNIAIRDVVPDLVVLVDMEPLEALKRAESRAGAQNVADLDRFEKEKIEFHNRVREGFLVQARESTQPFLILDGRLSQGELTDSVCRVIGLTK